MVWAMSYRPKPDSYPLGEVVEGNADALELEDRTSDGGAGLATAPSFTGRRIVRESIPKTIRWKSKRKLLDYETTCIKTVSDGFRALIEEIEPGVHQFEPVRFIGKDRGDLGNRWFWQICNRIDSVHRGRTTMILPKFNWRSQVGVPPILVFDIAAIGPAAFWHDKHISNASYVSDATKSRIETAGITGVHFKHYEQA